MSAAPQQQAELVAAAEAFVRAELAAQDGSHDWHHIDRVRRVALSLAREERGCDVLVVELAALLHDVKDWKYSGSETAGADAVRAFLESRGCARELIERVVHVVAHVGFKNELGRAAGQQLQLTPELAVVQDADRLDAIGAIGIARCFTFGGARNRAIYDPARAPERNLTKEAYAAQRDAPSINHFFEKLLRLKELMKSEAGRRRAEARHAFMEAYLKQFFAEVAGEA